MSYQPPAFGSVSPDTSDDPYQAPAYDVVDFGSAAGLTIAAPVTALQLPHLQAAVSGAGTIVLNSPRTDMSLAGKQATPTGSGTVALSTPSTAMQLTPEDATAFTLRSQNTPQADGWLVEIDHPTSGRTLSPTVLDEPSLIPSLNGFAEIRVPVRRDPEWIDPAYDANPEMRVWHNGRRQPIDELREVEQTPERSVLVGVGGVELETRVEATFDTEERQVAARQLVSANTSYATDVDTPVYDTQTDVRLADYSASSELETNATVTATDPVHFVSGQARLSQVCFNQTVDDIQANGNFVVKSTQTGAANAVDGDIFVLQTPNTHYVEFPIDLTYDIGAEDATTLVGGLETQIRMQHTGSSTDSVTFRVDIDGADSGIRITSNENNAIEWTGLASDTKDPSGLSAGTHTIRYTLISNAANVEVLLDNIALYDDKFAGDLSFPNTVDANKQLSGPELYPQNFLLEYRNDFTTAFSFTRGDVFASMNDVSNNQYVGISFDRGQTFQRAQNSQSIDTTPSGASSTIRFEVNLSRYGSRTTETPTSGFNGQTIEFVRCNAGIEEALLLIDEDYDRDLLSILNEIATDDEFIWSYRIEDGTPTVSWTQPGTRRATRDPDIGDVQISKDATNYPRVTVKGSPQPVSSEQFTASTSFVSLAESEILVGSESVYDASTGEQFVRGADYELNRETGEIKITNSGDMSVNTVYEIDYRHEIKATSTADNAPAAPRELVEEVPGVSSVRQAEQIAFTLVRQFNDVSYAVDLTIPSDELDFDVLDAFTLENLDIPQAATPLEVRGSPTETPRGLRIRLGTQSEIEREIRQLSQQLQKVSRRS